MLLKKAVEIALQCKNCYITRKSWKKDIYILPTNSIDCCVLMSDNQQSAPRWNPYADDLIANDWIVIKE